MCLYKPPPPDSLLLRYRLGCDGVWGPEAGLLALQQQPSCYFRVLVSPKTCFIAFWTISPARPFGFGALMWLTRCHIGSEFFRGTSLRAAKKALTSSTSARMSSHGSIGATFGLHSQRKGNLPFDLLSHWAANWAGGEFWHASAAIQL